MTSVGWRIAKVLAVLAIIAWSIAPILIGVSTSISTQREVNDVPTKWVPHSPTLQAYHDLLGGTSSQRAGGTVTEAGTFTRSIYNSAVLSAVSTVFILIFATMAAYAFGRLQLPVRRRRAGDPGGDDDRADLRGRHLAVQDPRRQPPDRYAAAGWCWCSWRR